MNPVSNIWAPYPFVRFVCTYITGIIIFRLFPFYLYYDYILLIAGVIVTCFFLVWGKYKINAHSHQKFYSVFGFTALLLLALAGYSSCSIVKKLYTPQFAATGVSAYRVVIAEQPVKRNKVNRAVAVVTHVRKNTAWIESGGKILLSFVADDESDSLKPGSVILFEKKPEKIANSGNPGSTDFAQFWGDKFLYFRVFLRAYDYSCSGYEKPPFYSYYSAKAADFLAFQLSKYIHHQNEKGVALALFLGIKDHIDNELLQSYSAAGVMHVLAVSGMHVAVLFQLFSMLLGRIPFLKKYERFSNVLLLVFIWFYGFITGGSASVMRAVVMFSFIVLGKLLGRRSNIYNSLSLSAFVLLLYNPFLLFDVGFQLSYLAVTGIVYIQPRFEKYWSPESTVAGYFADIIKVSVAAQLATFPLSVYYFQQFPTYFLISNLFIIPVSAAAMYAGIFLLFTCWISPLAILSGFVTEYLLLFMNYIVYVTEILPFSVINGIKINGLQCICLYLIIALTPALFSLKKIKYSVFLAVIAVVFSIATIRTKPSENNALLFYNIPKSFVMENIRGNSSRIYLWNTDSVYANKVIHTSHSELGIEKSLTITLPDSGNWVCTMEDISVVMMGKNKNTQLPDYCLVLVINSAFSYSQFEKLASLSYRNLLISSALPVSERTKWKNVLSGKNIPFIDLSEGAHQIEIRN